MIFQAIDIIHKELNKELNLLSPPVTAEVGNIGEILATNNQGSDKDIIISLINIEENRISRDPRNYLRTETGMLMKNPAVHLNITLLFTSVKLDTGYQFALQNIQHVIEFFQNKYVFDHINTPDLDAGIEKLILEMISFNLEQLHQLWSMLGGKYHPSAAYRMRMITIDNAAGVPGPLIKEIEANYHLK
ncbi:MAG: DUF4255 domain-containing protein [Bacteroidota bacterium]|nr:DUF4255 domain-containing protein [Bacteroidota bacterium]